MDVYKVWLLVYTTIFNKNSNIYLFEEHEIQHVAEPKPQNLKMIIIEFSDFSSSSQRTDQYIPQQCVHPSVCPQFRRPATPPTILSSPILCSRSHLLNLQAITWELMDHESDELLHH